MKNKNKILSNRIVILLIFIFHFLFIPAQNIRDLEKVNKVYIKELKSKGYKSVDIKTVDNGFWYFLVGKKIEGKKVYGVIDKDRKELFECKYTQIAYLPEIPDDGYRYHTFPSMQGGEETVSIYHYAMPGHFVLEDMAGHTVIAIIDGCIIKNINDDCFISGSWIITHSKKIYIRNYCGCQRLMLVNNDTKNIGLMTWDGKEIVKNENFLMYITSKTKDTFNATFVFNTKNNAGGFYCEDLNVIVPTEYEEIEANYKKRTFNVKLSPIDKLHEYNPDIKEVYIPKNQGEQYLKEHKYKECIEYYSKTGVDDSDSKFFSSYAMFGIATGHIMKLQNHLSAPSVNSRKGYDYQEAKSLLQNAIEILNTATIQDTIRQDIYKENISTYKKYLNILETNNSILKKIVLVIC